MSNRDDVLKSIRSMQALPPAAAELIPLLQDPDADAEAICKAISYDSSLTAYVLRTANSSLLGSRAEVTTVREALVRLGTKAILSTVLGSVAGPIAMKPVQGYNLRSGSLWEGSVGVALATEEFATILGMKTPAEAFTAGLLIDIGKIVLGAFVESEGDSIRQLAFGQGISFERAEREVLGIDHAEAGATLLEAWHLPEGIVEIVRWHHEPDRCSAQNRAIGDLIHLADHACTLAGLGGGDDGTHYVPSQSSVSRLGLSTQQIEQGMCNTFYKLEEARELFGLVPERQGSWPSTCS